MILVAIFALGLFQFSPRLVRAVIGTLFWGCSCSRGGVARMMPTFLRASSGWATLLWPSARMEVWLPWRA
jgi:hypothetical protein